MKRSVLVFLAMLVFTPPVVVSAQTNQSTETPPIPADIRALLEKGPENLTEQEKEKVSSTLRPLISQGVAQTTETANTPGAINCFDYYHFGSVQVDVSPTLAATVPGATMGFMGWIKNTNDYPIVAGEVYAKIFFKKTQDDVLTHQNGYALIDQFAVKDNLSLAAKGEQELSFTWDVPYAAETGDYQIAFYFASAKRYNLLGLSFTDDVNGNTADFSILGSTDVAVSFDKNAVKLNGNPYAFAAFPPHFTEDEKVKAEVKLTNPKNETILVPVSWKLYAWDGLREEALRDLSEEVVTLKPKETKILSHLVPAINASVSYLVVEAKDQDMKSLLDIRFVRDGIEETRINFPSITTYPLKEGEEATVFSCAHSTNQPIVKGNILKLTLRDESDQIIHAYRYQGDITGDMMGVQDVFTPGKTYTTFSLTASLERDGQILEAVTQKYRCQDIDKALCPKTVAGSIQDIVIGKRTSLLIALTLSLFLGLVIWKVWKDKKGSLTRVISFLAVVIVSGMMFFGGATGVEAKSVVSSNGWQGGGYPYLAQFATDAGIATGWWTGIRNNLSVNVTYVANVTNLDTGTVLSSGATIPTGTQLFVGSKPFAATDISWFATGESADSPYGHWVAGAGPSSAPGVCDPADHVNVVDFSSWYGLPAMTQYENIYIPFSVNPPAVTYSHSGTATLSCDASGQYCTVTSPGTINFSVNYPATYGKFYQRVDIHYGVPGLDGCYGGNAGLQLSNYMSPVGGVYVHSIPAQTIPFTFTAVSSNNPPNPPTITGPVNTTATLSNAFTLWGSDPDNDTVRYGIDLDNNGTVDMYAPSFGYVASNTSQITNRAWPTAGVKTFRARTEDSKGGVSGWTSHTITVAPAPTLTFTAAPTVFPYTGGTTTLSWTTSGTSCWASGGWTGWQATTGTPTSVQPVSATTTFTLECWDGTGASSGPRSAVITVTPAPAPTVSLLINGAHSNISLFKGSTYTISWSVADAASCSASSSDDFGGVIATTPSTGSFTVTADQDSTPTLSCTGFGGLVTSDSLFADVTCISSTSAYGSCNCPTEKKSRHVIEASCNEYDESIDCSTAEKNACRDFNWKEVAP